MHDPRTFSGDHVRVSARVATTVNHPMTVSPANVGRPLIKRYSTALLLSRQVIKWTTVTSSHKLGTTNCPQFLKSTLLLENLRQRLQLRNTLRPLPLGATKSVSVLR